MQLYYRQFSYCTSSYAVFFEFPHIPVVLDDDISFDLGDLDQNESDLTDLFAQRILIDKKEAHALERRTVLQR